MNQNKLLCNCFAKVQFGKLEKDFEDLANSKMELDDMLKVEREASSAKDEIIKCQDKQILELEVASFFFFFVLINT